VKKLVIATVAIVVVIAPAATFLFSSINAATIAASAASRNACVSPIGAVAPMGGPVRFPLAGRFVVTSEFGVRANPGQVNHGEVRLHAGIDLQHVDGPGQVVAASAGVVSGTPVEEQGGGNMVVVDHGGGLVTRYLHLADVGVEVGDVVWAGRALGTEGETGNSAGRHLHFQVEMSGRPVDPRSWLTEQGLSVPPTNAAGVGGPVVAIDPGASPLLPVAPAPLAPTSAPGATAGLVGKLPAQVGVWKGEQVSNAAQVIKAGQDRGLDATTITIAVMTAMAESSLRNLAHGDAVRNDTIGLFQEGPERGPYEQRMDPYGAAGIFYDYLLRVPNYLELEPTIAAHKAQANADPYHYEPRWPEAVQMVSTLTDDPELLADLPAAGPVTGCEDGGPVPLPDGGDGTGEAIVEAAKHYLDTPYSWGGGDITGPTLGTFSSPSLDGTRTVGFDCSGLVMFAVHHATGIVLPHKAEHQGTDPRGAVVPRDWGQMRPGDVIAFSEDGSGAPGSFGHSGIYIGDDRMIHAPVPGKRVEIVELRGSAYFEPMVWNIRRYAG
jgi:cell wall-associated NlpC family hydrolase